ncbi:MAG: outer membrane protein assembly factor BamE [Pseudomonadota bacterium]
MKTLLISALLACCTLAITACSSYRFPGAYRIDVQQGNILKASDIAKIQRGMSKDQVRYVLGTPLTTNNLNSNRWTYLYSLREGNGNNINKRLDVLFDSSGKVSEIKDTKR